MANARITSDDLESIIRLKTGLPAQPFIEEAEAVTNQLEGLPVGAPHTDAELKAIELRLAAHFVYLSYPPPSSFSEAGHSRTLDKGQTGNGLNGTPHGRAALMLDRSGILSTLGLSAKESAEIPVAASITFISSHDPDSYY